MPAKKEEKEKESMLEVANCCLAESEKVYININLNSAFVSDDSAGSSGWMKFILEGTLKCREQVPPKRSYFPVSLNCHQIGYKI